MELDTPYTQMYKSKEKMQVEFLTFLDCVFNGLKEMPQFGNFATLLDKMQVTDRFPSRAQTFALKLHFQSIRALTSRTPLKPSGNATGSEKESSLAQDDDDKNDKRE